MGRYGTISQNFIIRTWVIIVEMRCERIVFEITILSAFIENLYPYSIVFNVVAAKADRERTP